jgi:hypothetical protein
MMTKTKLTSLCVISLLLFACSERPTEYYPKHKDAVKAGAVKRGWIHEIVPATATEIHEQHDLDTNDLWIRFTLATSDKDRLVPGLKRLSHDEILRVKARKPSSVDWWFEGLIQQSPANDNALNAEIYVVKCGEDKSGFIAFDRTSQRVYYWCTR